MNGWCDIATAYPVTVIGGNDWYLAKGTPFERGVSSSVVDDLNEMRRNDARCPESSRKLTGPFDDLQIFRRYLHYVDDTLGYAKAEFQRR